jgi:hypothetical protein
MDGKKILAGTSVAILLTIAFTSDSQQLSFRVQTQGLRFGEKS